MTLHAFFILTVLFGGSFLGGESERIFREGFAEEVIGAQKKLQKGVSIVLKFCFKNYSGNF